MAMAITPQPGILEIKPYQGGEAHLPGVADVLKLSSNENPFGPSGAARAAFATAAPMLHRYPPTDHAALRAAIGEVEGLDPARIICGVGSDEILSLLCQAYAGPGDEVVYPAHGFSMYRISALGAGARPVVAPERDRRVDVAALLAAMGPRTRLAFLANPANPTGTALGAAELAALADGMPDGAILVIDGAYAEYADADDGAAHLAATRGNVVITRTFSKIHGLGGLRIGWGFGPAEVIGVLDRIRGPFNLSGPALAAAEAAMRDTAHRAFCKAENARLRGWLAARLAACGVPSAPSQGNFILARLADAAEAEAADAHLRAAGIIVRRVAGYGLPEALRITIGREEDCARVAAAVADFMRGRR
ncbi:MAG: histidinol-phosphate transaminase [Gemmobacter sp.]